MDDSIDSDFFLDLVLFIWLKPKRASTSHIWINNNNDQETSTETIGRYRYRILYSHVNAIKIQAIFDLKQFLS